MLAYTVICCLHFRLQEFKISIQEVEKMRFLSLVLLSPLIVNHSNLHKTNNCFNVSYKYKKK